MKIISMKLINFRQFKGENTIEFSDGNKNTTLIIGDNGNGKTGIFRALMFALYGDITIWQDENASQILLVNKDLLENNGGIPIEASVELVFENEGITYIIERKINTFKSGREYKTRLQDPNLFEINEIGETVPLFKDKESTENFINNIIDYNIRDFFFFDAEEMSLLDEQKSSKTISTEIKDGITQLLQIQYLEEGREILNKEIKIKEKEIQKKVNDTKLDEIRIYIEGLRNKLDTIKNENSLINEKLNNIKYEKNIVKDKLNKNQGIKDLYKEIENMEAYLYQKKETLKAYKNNSNEIMVNSSRLLANDLLQKNKSLLEGFIEKRPDQLPLNVIKKSLKDCQCALCRTTFDKDSEQERYLLHLEEQYIFTNYTSVATNIINLAFEIDRDKNSEEEKLNNNISSIIKINEEIEELNRKIEMTNAKIKKSSYNSDDLRIINDQLEEYEKQEKDLQQNLINNESIIHEIENELSLKEKDLKKIEDNYGDYLKEIKIKDKLKQYLDVLDSSIIKYRDSIIPDLSSTLFKYFSLLLNEKDTSIYSRIDIDEDFNIKLIDNYENDILSHLSMGQGQIFSLAFVLSLANLASKGKETIDFPLFMDTPFARLDTSNRKNVIENVPQLTNQLILLLTDTELTDYEREIFNRANSVGKKYQLLNERGVSKIIQIN